MGINELLKELPASDSYRRSMPISEAEDIGISPCGETFFGLPVYKMLTNDGFMHTYYKAFDILVYAGSQKLHQ